MFTGIIEKVAPLLLVQTSGTSAPTSVELSLDTGFDDLALGESVAINGVCLTVARLEKSQASFFVSPETLEKTQLGQLKRGELVNLERALSVSSRLSGHIVQGHVDGIATLTSIVEVSPETYELTVSVPEALTKYCVEKGSITLDGVSLTINRIDRNILSLMIIPHTMKHTRLHTLKPGAALNLEVDVMAKYLEKLCQPYKTQSTH